MKYCRCHCCQSWRERLRLLIGHLTAGIEAIGQSLQNNQILRSLFIEIVGASAQRNDGAVVLIAQRGLSLQGDEDRAERNVSSVLVCAQELIGNPYHSHR